MSAQIKSTKEFRAFLQAQKDKKNKPKSGALQVPDRHGGQPSSTKR